MIPDDPSFMTQVEFFIKGKNLKDMDTFSKSDPICRVYLMTQGVHTNYVKVGETEEIKDNLNPDFKTTIKIDYEP